MTNLQFNLIFAASLVSLLLSVGINVALYIHLSTRIYSLEDRIDERLALILSKISDLNTRLSVLQNREHR